MKEHKFVFIVPVFNAAKTIQQMLMSIVCQTYPHWRIIIRDDMSTDDTVDKIQKLSKLFGIEDRVHITVNDRKHWEVENIVKMLPLVDPHEIVCRIDGDDWLCDLDALALINAEYKRTGADVLWTAHRWSFTRHNISEALPRNADPYRHRWVSSHLKTFRKVLIEGVKDENFRGQDGQYYKRIGDQALLLPVLHRAGGNWVYFDIVAYHYSIVLKPETFQSDDAKFQQQEALFLRQRGFIS